MKLKNLLEWAGLRASPQQYHYRVESFDIGLDDPVQLAQWMHPREKPKTITLDDVNGYRSIIDEGDFCIDIGAHTGDTTVPMALAAGPEGCVLAMEPNPYVFHVLQKNARLNKGRSHIETLMAAATPENCFMEFEYSDSGFCNGGRHENISALKHGHNYKLSVFGVDLAAELQNDYAHLLDRLKYIKVDAEGYDLYILQAIEAIIKTHRPFIKAEIFKKTDEAYRKGIFDFLSGLGYRVYRVEREPVGHGETELGRDDMLAWKHFDILARPS